MLNEKTETNVGWWSLRRRATSWMLALGVLTAGACDNILDVDLPGNVEAGALNNPGFAQTLVLGAQNDFECAFNVYVQTASMWATELVDASTWATPRQWQTRITSSDGGAGRCPEETFRDGGTYGPYAQLQTARGQAVTAKRLIEGFGLSNGSELIATVEAYQAYATLILGEAYCEMRIDARTETLLTPAQTIQAAADLFQSAIGASTGDVQNMARVGRARALARLGDLSGADAVAAQVPAGFVYNATHDGTPTRRNNFVYIYNYENLFTTIDEDYRGLTVGGVPDSRVPVVQGVGLVPNDGVTDIWLQELYTDAGSDVPLATWVEAQLIRAEAALDAGDAGAAEGFIDAVRAAYNLPDYATDPGGPATMDQLLEERRRTLFLQSHRLGDLQFYGQPFKWSGGTDHKGRPVTTNTCFDLPDAETQG
jgi:hypothetical protein